MAEYIKIGKLVAVFGLKGELILQHTLGKKSALKGLEVVFVEDKKNSFLPWFIQEARAKSDTEIYLKLENVDSREAAMKLTQKELWLPEEVLRQYAAKSSPVSLLGYTVIQGKDPLGPILELIEQPHQLLCRLDIRGHEVLIPLHEETLQRIDHRKRQVLVTLPDGLLDIYLSES